MFLYQKVIDGKDELFTHHAKERRKPALARLSHSDMAAHRVGRLLRRARMTASPSSPHHRQASCPSGVLVG